MWLSVLVAVVTLNPISHAQGTRSCEQRLLATEGAGSVCGEWLANQSPILQRFDDGTMVPNPYSLEGGKRGGPPRELRNLIRPSSTSRTDNARTIGAIQSVVDSMKEQIRNGVPDSELNAHQRYMLDRLSRIQIDTNPSDPDACAAPNHFNAAYAQASNTISVCPILTHMPPEAYIALIAHELGHLADPCNMTDIYPFAGPIASAPEAQLRGAIDSSVRQCLQGQPQQTVTAFSEWAQDNNRVSTRTFPLYPGDPKRQLTERLVSCGLATRPDVPAATTYAGHPYLPVISCVGGSYPRPHELQAAAVSSSKSGVAAPAVRASSRFGNPTPLEASDTVGSDRHPHVCDRTMNVKETTADHVGASLLQYHLRRLPSTVRADRRQYLGYFFQTTHCSSGNRPSPDYLPSADRFRVFLQVAGLGQALGCDASQVQTACSINENGASTPSSTLASQPTGTTNRAPASN